jgi:hypothetical protein
MKIEQFYIEKPYGRGMMGGRVRSGNGGTREAPERSQ